MRVDQGPDRIEHMFDHSAANDEVQALISDVIKIGQNVGANELLFPLPGVELRDQLIVRDPVTEEYVAIQWHREWARTRTKLQANAMEACSNMLAHCKAGFDSLWLYVHTEWCGQLVTDCERCQYCVWHLDEVPRAS